MRGKDYCNCEHVDLWRDAALAAIDALERLPIKHMEQPVQDAFHELEKARDADDMSRDEFVDTALESGE